MLKVTPLLSHDDSFDLEYLTWYLKYYGTGEWKPAPSGGPFYDTAEWRDLRLAVKIRDNSTCYYCGKTAQTADHVIPRKGRGGATLGPFDTLDNLVACCRVCNSIAGGYEFPSLAIKKAWIRAHLSYFSTLGLVAPAAAVRGR